MIGISLIARRSFLQGLLAISASWAANAPAQTLAAAKIFAPGTISGGANDGAPTFSPNGRTLYFDRSNSRWSAILESHLTGGKWSTPQLASFAGVGSNLHPALSPDGQHLIFVSTRRILRDGSSKPISVSHLYSVERVAGKWSSPVELPAEVNVADYIFKPSIAANGDIFFMAPASGASPIKWRLHVSRRTATGYRMAEPLAFSGPTENDVDPYIAADQSFLIFSSTTRADPKDEQEHLYIVSRGPAGWLQPRRIRYSGDDAKGDDGDAQLGPDHQTLYFMSNRSPPFADPPTAVARMESWDTGNNNVWTLALPDSFGRAITKQAEE